MNVSRRAFLEAGVSYTIGAATAGCLAGLALPGCAPSGDGGRRGSQRLSLAKLQAWEKLGYGMFIHFGMSTFLGNELPDGTAPASTYAPDKLDVDQWVAVARDAGMKYAVLTAKHVAGHCLWPSKHTDYTVANSANTIDVVGKFVEACRIRGVEPGLYYCSWDNHHRFGSKTPSDGGDWNGMNSFPTEPPEALPPYTTSLYQHFQTAQITELIETYGPIAEMWIDIPGLLGQGYRTYLYNHIARLQPDVVIMMNSGKSDGADYKAAYAWPSDLIALERNAPPETGHQKWRRIEGKAYYMPGEICDPIGHEWFYVPGDVPRPDEALLGQLLASRQRGANLLLNVPPDPQGLIPDAYVNALTQLRRDARL